MPGGLSWALIQARKQTLSLVAGVPQSAACSQAFEGEHHPAWIVGHLLLADSYLLHLLGVEELGSDFSRLLTCFGPGATPTPEPGPYDSLDVLVARLRDTGEERVVAVHQLAAADYSRPLPDPVLARVQPTIGHHLNTLIYHEGYHGGQLAAWRRNHHLPPAPWTFAPPAD
jgi:hypothetical protein